MNRIRPLHLPDNYSEWQFTVAGIQYLVIRTFAGAELYKYSEESTTLDGPYRLSAQWLRDNDIVLGE